MESIGRKKTRACWGEQTRVGGGEGRWAGKLDRAGGRLVIPAPQNHGCPENKLQTEYKNCVANNSQPVAHSRLLRIFRKRHRRNGCNISRFPHAVCASAHAFPLVNDENWIVVLNSKNH